MFRSKITIHVRKKVARNEFHTLSCIGQDAILYIYMVHTSIHSHDFSLSHAQTFQYKHIRHTHTLQTEKMDFCLAKCCYECATVIILFLMETMITYEIRERDSDIDGIMIKTNRRYCLLSFVYVHDKCRFSS